MIGDELLLEQLEDEREAARRKRKPGGWNRNVGADQREWADRIPLTVRCSWCGWEWEGPAGVARARAREHRATHRPGGPDPAPGGIVATYDRVRGACSRFSALTASELDEHAQGIALVCARARATRRREEHGQRGGCEQRG